jgi:ribosome-dependent ATPase
MAGAKKLQQGEMTVLGGDIADVRHRREACPRIAYMPQGLGKNLYLRLSVADNVDFMAQLFGLSKDERPIKIKQLLEATGLGPFHARPAGQALGRHEAEGRAVRRARSRPDLLVLDEPTTGVDPLSRRPVLDADRRHSATAARA